MPFSPDQIADLRVRHLEMLQSVIARIAGYSASIKTFCITLTTAILGFAITPNRPIVVLLTYLPIAVFAALHTQYLRTERRYRLLFDKVRSESLSSVPDLRNGHLCSFPRRFLECFSELVHCRILCPSRIWHNTIGNSCFGLLCLTLSYPQTQDALSAAPILRSTTRTSCE
jgi:hypothetical protein